MTRKHHPETDDLRSFPEILEAELGQILQRRAAHGLEHEADKKIAGLQAEGSAERLARQEGLVGLALSGGGIRSATFNLGLLQGLAKLQLLPRLDYLSTVSG